MTWLQNVKNQKLLRQSLILALWSFLFVLPLLLKIGPNIVTRTFQEGADRFYRGESPYLPPGVGTDVFHYPPFFAVIWGAFDFLGLPLKVLVWTFLNAFVFWWGISQWWLFEKKQSSWTWFLLICTGVELDISLRYQQSNALVAGLVLMALAALRDVRMGRAGFYLALATHIKVFPVLIVLLLAPVFPINFAFLGSFVGGLLICFSLPSLLVGPQQAFWLHWDQYQAITQDFSRREMLDIAPCLARLGYPLFGKIVQKSILIISALVLFVYRLRIPDSKFRWQPWYSFFVTTLLLVTPRAESPTFIWAAPAYLLFYRGSSKGVLASLVIIGFFLSLVYSSVFAGSNFEWFRWNWTSKTLSTLLLWALSLGLLVSPRYHRNSSGLT